MKKRFLTLLVSLLTLSLLSMIPVHGQEDLQNQNFLLTFIPNIQFSPLYVSIEQGYFVEHGLNITVNYLNEPDVVDLIAAGTEQFGMVSGEQVILSRAQGRPVVYVYEWFQKFPVGIVVSSDSQVETIADLAGERIGVPGRFGASYSGLITLLLSAGMSDTDIQIEEIGYNAPDVMCVGAIGAAVVYTNNEPLQIRNRAAQGDCGSIQDVKVINVSDVADIVSNGIVTSEALIEDDPELVTVVVEAFDRGLSDVINNPARAYLISLDYVENLPIDDDFRAALEEEATAQDEFLATDPDREAIAASRGDMYTRLLTKFGTDSLIQFEVLLASIDLWEADQLGYSDLSSWETMQTTLLEMGFLKDGIALPDAFTNAFLPAQE